MTAAQKPPVRREKCGTYAGTMAHAANGEAQCAPCRIARNDYAKVYRASEGGQASLARDKVKKAVRGKAMRLLARRHAAELAWLIEQIGKGAL